MSRSTTLPSDELIAFRELQAHLDPLFRRIQANTRRAPQTVVVVPSLTLDREVLSKIAGAHHYEERLLCMLMLLRLPRTQVVYLSSQPLDPAIIDYYLHLMPGIPSGHARQRLTLLHCHDSSPLPLTRKILDRPRLIERIRGAIADRDWAYMRCFNATDLERSLAIRLGIPLYGCDPARSHLGTKSGSREVFRAAGVDLPDGFERLNEEAEVVEALTELKRRNPELRRAAVKLDEGFSGEGNAVFSYDGSPEGGGLAAWVRRELPERLRFEAAGETWERFSDQYRQMGGIVEEFIEGDEKRSPSAQCRIDPRGQIEMISTHDQVLGGPTGQVFLGCTFPADGEYRLEIQAAALRVAEVLQRGAVLGRFGVDFVSARRGDTWRHYAIEINLRKGGTTHPFMMLEFLTDGSYDLDTGLYRTAAGQPRYYHASDNLRSPRYVGLTPNDLIEVAVQHQLHFHGASQQGVVFHLIGALSEFGKLGVLCVAEDRQGAESLYRDTVEILDRESRAGRPKPESAPHVPRHFLEL